VVLPLNHFEKILLIKSLDLGEQEIKQLKSANDQLMALVFKKLHMFAVLVLFKEV
jgi:hypothetical protein